MYLSPWRGGRASSVLLPEGGTLSGMSRKAGSLWLPGWLAEHRRRSEGEALLDKIQAR